MCTRASKIRLHCRLTANILANVGLATVNRVLLQNLIADTFSVMSTDGVVE